jgi:hypothetical protein
MESAPPALPAAWQELVIDTAGEPVQFAPV